MYWLFRVSFPFCQLQLNVNKYVYLSIPVLSNSRGFGIHQYAKSPKKFQGRLEPDNFRDAYDRQSNISRDQQRVWLFRMVF